MKHKQFLTKHKRRYYSIFAISLLLLALKFIPTLNNAHTLPQPGLYSINHFIDGDTIEVNMNNKAEAVRFIGVDTPETHKPNSPVQCYGVKAADFTKQTIGHNKIRLQADPLDTNRDRYNRLLRYVYLPNNLLVNKLLIEQGLGFAYTQFPFSKMQEFVAAQQYAQRATKGLWSSCQPYQEPNGRWQTESLNSGLP